MTIRSLDTIPFETLMECFNVSFENYFVPMSTDLNFWEARWAEAKVDYNLSFGMFENETLIGFIINAIDTRNGHKIAFNTGTGVLPEHRGKKIVKKIYAHALGEFKKNEITKCSLEVITTNERAIKSYQSIGFQITRTLKCFSGVISSKKDSSLTIIEKKLSEIKWDQLPNQSLYSWDNQTNSVLKGPYQYFQILNYGQPESYFICNPDNGYIAQFDVLSSNNLAWERLFLGIRSISETIKINNVDAQLIDKIEALKSNGLKNTIDQYEMELPLK